MLRRQNSGDANKEISNVFCMICFFSVSFFCYADICYSDIEIGFFLYKV